MGEQGGDQNVKVAIRCRPLSQKELGNSESSIVEVKAPSSDQGPGSIAINDPDGKEHPTSFAFDIVFDVNTEQSHVFDLIGRPALDSTMNGFNGTIFAYGQTGSGKSWCMSGGAGDLRGIIPRVNELLFDRIAAEQAEVSTKKFLVMCSFFEIYNEIIFDLLNPPADRSKLGAGLQVKEHPVLGIYVKDLGEIVVNDAAKLESLMSNGVKNRAVSSTLMNATSSRSHSIFTIKVHQKDDQDTSKNVFAKLNLVDLAGSERQKGTGASGQTLKEGANINKSLSALGNVINALVENAGGKKVFVPYRNSKLTRVLQESLGGNSLCTMLATLSPAACNYEETLSTLRYANRAKAIKVSAVKNEEASQISRLNAEILELKKKLASSGGQEGGAMGHMADEERQELQAKYKAQLSEMQQMVNSTWEEKARLSADHETQLNKALQAHKRQAKAMEEECNKRFRLLQEQNDLEFSIRGLLDTLQSVPLKDGAAGASAPLRSGELPKKWLKMVADIDETVDALKERNTTSQVFQAAYVEELRLWVEGEEASDAGMVRTGARRALMKLETLKKECAKLVEMQAECGRKLQELAAKVQEVCGEWEASGSAAVLAELQGEDTQGAEPEQGLEGVRGILSQTLQDISRILRLIQEQAQGKVVQLDGTTSVAMSATCELLLKGMSLSGFEHNVASDIALLRTTSAASEAGSPPADQPGTEPAAQPRPREERPLHEWTPEDADDTVQGTAYTLALLVPLETLHKKKSPEELLARPPPKFVHDVALLVQQVTGFPSTLTEEWSENREAKLDILQSISDSTAGCLGIGSIEFDPADVLKGKEVEKTLRLLQLLAMAAAKEKANPGVAVSAARAHRDRRKAEGQVSSAEMSALLETMARCVQGVLQHLEEKQVEDGHASPTRELESKYKALQERLREETEMRKRQESRLAELKEQLQQIGSKVSEGAATLDRCRQAATDAAEKKGEMRRHVEQLRGGLLHRAQQLDSNPQVNQTRVELEQMTAQLQSQLERKSQLAADVKKLAQHRTEVESHKESLELEVRLVKLRLAEGMTNITPTQSDEVLQLQAEKQKLDVRVTALEERLRAISDSDDMERENSLIEENKLLQGKLDEAQTQLQVMTEERDALREGMQQHWQEKTQMEEEVLQVAQGYTALSTRAMDIKDEIRELQEKLHEYETLLSMLEELNNHSPQASGRGDAASLGVATDKASSTCGNAAASTGPTATGGDDEEGSSHYSDDPFEEPEED